MATLTQGDYFAICFNSIEQDLQGRIEDLHKRILQIETTLVDDQRADPTTDTLRIKLRSCINQISTVLNEIGEHKAGPVSWSAETEWLNQKKALLEARTCGMWFPTYLLNL